MKAMKKKRIEIDFKILPSGKWEVPKDIRAMVNKNFGDPEVAMFAKMIFEAPKVKLSYSLIQYYFAVVVPLVLCGMIDVGHNELCLDDKEHKQDMHRMLKKKFLKMKEVRVGDELIEIEPSITDCDNVEFWRYLNDCGEWAAEFLYTKIPMPRKGMEIDDKKVIPVKAYLAEKRLEFLRRI